MAALRFLYLIFDRLVGWLMLLGLWCRDAGRERVEEALPADASSAGRCFSSRRTRTGPPNRVSCCRARE